MGLREPFANHPLAFAKHAAKSLFVLPHPVSEHAMLLIGRSVRQPTGPAKSNNRTVHQGHSAARTVELLLNHNRVVPVPHPLATNARGARRHSMITGPHA
jgi:hypothetical protein